MATDAPTIMVTPYSRNSGAIFIGLQHMRADKVVLVALLSNKKNAEPVQDDLHKFKVASETVWIRTGSIEEFFQIFSDIKNKSPHARIIVNLGCADKALTCSALAAAFINGAQTFDVENDEVLLMPVLKFDYVKLLSEKKMALLHRIAQKPFYDSFESLSVESGLSLPLVSYHVRGSKQTQGLAQMGLVNVSEHKGKMRVSASPLGKLLLSGYAQAPVLSRHPLK